jgi:hypothetical protein
VLWIKSLPFWGLQFPEGREHWFLFLFLLKIFLKFIYHIILLGVHCDIYKSA